MDHRIEALENPKKAHCQGTAFEKSSEPSTVRLESFHGFPSSTQERPIQNFQYSTHKAKWGNPAPLTMLGLCMSLTCISCDLLGWRGSGGGGAATVGTYYFMGGTLMVIAGILEFFLGNTFPFVVSCGFGGHWLTLGATLTPGFGAWAAYANDPRGNPYQGLTEPSYLASFAWFFLCMAIFSFVGTICALRTNVPNVICFFFLLVQYCLLCGTYWTQANGQKVLAARLQIAAGAAGIVVVSSGWYLFSALLLEGADSPLRLPVVDLSKKTKIEGLEEHNTSLDARRFRS